MSTILPQVLRFSELPPFRATTAELGIVPCHYLCTIDVYLPGWLLPSDDVCSYILVAIEPIMVSSRLHGASAAGFLAISLRNVAGLGMIETVELRGSPNPVSLASGLVARRT